MVKDSSLLRRHYAASRRSKVDLLSILPTDLAYLVFDNTCHEVRRPRVTCLFAMYYWLQVMPCLVIVRINRLLRFSTPPLHYLHRYPNIF